MDILKDLSLSYRKEKANKAYQALRTKARTGNLMIKEAKNKSSTQAPVERDTK